MSWQPPDPRLQRLLNAIRGGVMGGNEYRVQNMPRCKVTRNAALSLNTGTLLSIPWDDDSGISCYDIDNMWSSLAPTLITPKTAGLYAFYAQLYYLPGTTVGSYRQLYFQHSQTGRIHGQTVIGPVSSGGVVGTCLSISCHIPMNAGDSVIVNTAHNDATSPLGFNVNADNMWVQACLISTL